MVFLGLFHVNQRQTAIIDSVAIRQILHLDDGYSSAIHRFKPSPKRITHLN
jgi:hypothetical protein